MTARKDIVSTADHLPASLQLSDVSIEAARELGIEVWEEGGRVLIRLPRGRIPVETWVVVAALVVLLLSNQAIVIPVLDVLGMAGVALFLVWLLIWSLTFPILEISDRELKVRLRVGGVVPMVRHTLDRNAVEGLEVEKGRGLAVRTRTWRTQTVVRDQPVEVLSWLRTTLDGWRLHAPANRFLEAADQD